MGEWFILIIVLTFHFACFLCYWSIIVWCNPYYLFFFCSFIHFGFLTSLLKVSQICMVYFWALHSVLFAHVFDFVPVPWCYTTALKCNLKSERVSTSSFLLTQLLWLFEERNGSIWKLYLNIAIEILSKPPSIMEIS